MDARVRVREHDTGPTLVLYPVVWDRDGRVDSNRIDDLTRALEVPLEGNTSAEAWDRVHEHNMAAAGAVEEGHGRVHGATARALATSLSNHHLPRIEDATEHELETVRKEYFPRNTWPSPAQRTQLDESIRVTRRRAAADSPRDSTE